MTHKSPRRAYARLCLCVAPLAFASCAGKHEFRDVPVHVENLAFFRDTWAESRDQFLQLTEKARARYANAEAGSIPVPSKVADDLEVNWLYIPPTADPTTLVLLNSGIHGLEGFAGSAVQALFLREFLPTADLAHTGFLFIHGLNPYGMRFGQRVSENGVDLNRNAPVSPQVYATPNPGYSELNSFLNPKGKLDLSSPGETFFASRLVFVILTHGTKAFTQASLGGQYQFPDGIYYGGTKPEPQYGPLKELLQRHLPAYSFVLGLDLHTGVGRRSYMHIMTNPAPNAEYKQTAEQIFAGHPIDWPEAGDFYTTSGDFITWIEALAGPRRALAVTIEFGTLDSQTNAGGIKSMQNTIRANQAFHYGYQSVADERQVQEDLREMFFPSSRAWRSEVIRQSRETLFPVVRNLNPPSQTRPRDRGAKNGNPSADQSQNATLSP